MFELFVSLSLLKVFKENLVLSFCPVLFLVVSRLLFLFVQVFAFIVLIGVLFDVFCWVAVLSQDTLIRKVEVLSKKSVSQSRCDVFILKKKDKTWRTHSKDDIAF